MDTNLSLLPIDSPLSLMEIILLRGQTMDSWGGPNFDCQHDICISPIEIKTR